MKPCHPIRTAAVAVTLLLGVRPAGAAITSVVETNRGGDAAAIIEVSFDENALSMSDRTHQHRPAAFNSGTGLLSTAGDLIVPLPDYLVGNSYVRFANDARDNASYSAKVTADSPTTFYLLIDNRMNGPASNATKTNTTDPILGGANFLRWVTDNGWERVNTGISPNIVSSGQSQGDFTAVDEGADGSLNQFYSVYKFRAVSAIVLVRNNGITNTNMVGVIAAPAVVPQEPIVSFVAQPGIISPGDPAPLLTWLVAPTATTATIDQGVGNILPATNGVGAGSVAVTPAVDTTYTLAVNSPTGSEATPATVLVRPLAYFRVNNTYVDSGAAVTLSWRIRADATASISSLGNIAAQTAANGIGSVIVRPVTSTTYTITSTASGRTEEESVTVVVRPSLPTYALIDLGGTGGRAEPGAVGNAVVGAGPHNTNGTDLFPALDLTSNTADAFTIAVSNLDPSDNPVGGLDWRDRGDIAAPIPALARLCEDFVKNNAGMIRVTLGGLPAGRFEVLSYHLDPDNSQCADIHILVTDANGTAVDTGVHGDASFPAIPGVAGLTTSLVDSKSVRFNFTSNGIDDVMIYFDGLAAADREVPLDALWLLQVPATPVPPLRVLNVTRTVSAGSASVGLEFASTPGKIYTVKASPDLVNWSQVLTSTLPASAGVTTVFTEPGIPLTTTVRYYRVSEN